jgi:hypothetical protein
MWLVVQKVAVVILLESREVVRYEEGQLLQEGDKGRLL